MRGDRGREHLGYGLTEGHKKGLSEHDVRSMLQARSHCYPTQAYLARNSGRDQSAGVCRLCRKQVETYGHIQAGCQVLLDEHRTAHNIVAEATLAAIQEAGQHLEISAR